MPLNNGLESASNPVRAEACPEVPDEELIGRCQRGQMDAYETLVIRYRQKVYGLAYSMVRNEHDATDLAQETFIRAWQAIRRFKRNSSFYTWLYRITTNLCIDFVRRRERRPESSFEETFSPDRDADAPEPASKTALPTDELARKELAQRIDGALAELSPEHRAVIQLREFEGLEYSEIARAVGCSAGTVMSRLHYARKHLQKLLREAI